MVILIGTILTIGYNAIYDRGYSAADAVWVEKQRKVEEFRDTQITEIQSFAKTNLEQTLINQAKVTQDMKDILAKIKGKPLTTVDCAPTDTFTDGYNEILMRGNKK